MRNTPTSFPAYWDNFVLQAGFLDAVTMACYNSIKLIISKLFKDRGTLRESHRILFRQILQVIKPSLTRKQQAVKLNAFVHSN